MMGLGIAFMMSACGGGGSANTTSLPPSITIQPSSVTMVTGNNTSFSVAASGTALSYQWQVDAGSGSFSNVSDTGVYSGATTATLSLTRATLSMNASRYRVIVSGTVSPSATSDSATLTVAAQTKAVVTLATTGTLPGGLTIGGLQTDINYPVNRGLSITNSNVVASGVATGSTLIPNTAVSGIASIGNLTLSGAGFLVGEFATLTFTISPGNTVSISDFTIVPGSTMIFASDNATTDLSNQISVIIQRVTFQ